MLALGGLHAQLGPHPSDLRPGGLPPTHAGTVLRDPASSLHVRVRVAAGDEKGRLQLCLYVARPPFAEAQLEVLDDDRVRLTFLVGCRLRRQPPERDCRPAFGEPCRGRSPMRIGQRELVLHPLAQMRKLAWLVPTQHQLRYAGVLAPAAKLRLLVVPAGRVGVQRVWWLGGPGRAGAVPDGTGPPQLQLALAL